jgi:hypothetical protein
MFKNIWKREFEWYQHKEMIDTGLEHLPSMFEALDLILSTDKGKKKINV